MSNFMPLSSLSDDELLQRVYIDRKNEQITPLTLELATRLQHALDELRKPRRDPYDFGKEPSDGNDA